MKPEDYPLRKVGGLRLRMVPEYPNPDTELRYKRCKGCVACPDGETHDEDLCEELPGCDHNATIFVHEDQFTKYVVEFIRHRVS